MDDERLDELKSEVTVDNSRLEEIMEKELTPEMQYEFLEVFKKSQLFMPVSFSDDMFEGIEDSKPGDVFEASGGFRINCLKDDAGNKVVPLFTSMEVMEKANLRSSVYALYMEDLADMLKQTDEYAMVAVNPLAGHDINMPTEAFLSLFYEPTEDEMEFFESLNKILEVIRNNSVELSEKNTFVIRADENFMIESAVDGVFTVGVPLNVSSNPKYREDLKYTNILLMPEGKKFLPVGPCENELDIIIAPGTEFRLEDRLDEFTSLWMCGDQPFYEEN